MPPDTVRPSDATVTPDRTVKPPDSRVIPPLTITPKLFTVMPPVCTYRPVSNRVTPPTVCDRYRGCRGIKHGRECVDTTEWQQH